MEKGGKKYMINILNSKTITGYENIIIPISIRKRTLTYGTSKNESRVSVAKMNNASLDLA